MAVTAAAPLREHERPMSWARAILIATGFFFLTAILVGQLPSYLYSVSTASNLTLFEQGTLTLSLLAIGFGLICFEISFLYDPKPLIPWFLFAVVGLGIAALGLLITFQVGVGPHGSGLVNGQGWPATLPTSGYWIHPAWFQAASVNLASVGLIALIVGFGMFSFAILNPLVLSGRLVGPMRDLIVRFGIGLSFVILALYLTLYTFVPEAVGRMVNGRADTNPVWNVLLFIALAVAVLALQVWLLPVMVANRQRFMPGVYLHGVVGLFGNVGIPLLLIWALTYPVVNLVHGADSQQFWVSCSQKNNIPGSCTFTPFTGYIICAIVFSITFGLLIVGYYFWSTRRDTIVLGGTIGLLYVGIAVAAVHASVTQGGVDSSAMGLFIAAAVAVTAFVWTWGTQREFAPTSAQPLGCAGQWLVLGTLLLIYLFGFAIFSLPNFFEIEALALFFNPGRGNLHDAFWFLLLMGGLAALQMAFVIRRRPMSALRKFALWTMLGAVALMVIASIQGFHRNIFTGGAEAFESAHAIFLTGLIFGLLGVVVTAYGAFSAGSMRWLLSIVGVAALGLALAFVFYNLPDPYPELVEASFVLMLGGAFAYTAAGPDAYEEYDEYATNGNGYVASRP
jgi:hypothetical protein